MSEKIEIESFAIKDHNKNNLYDQADLDGFNTEIAKSGIQQDKTIAEAISNSSKKIRLLGELHFGERRLSPLGIVENIIQLDRQKGLTSYFILELPGKPFENLVTEFNKGKMKEDVFRILYLQAGQDNLTSALRNTENLKNQCDLLIKIHRLGGKIAMIDDARLEGQEHSAQRDEIMMKRMVGLIQEAVQEKRFEKTRWTFFGGAYHTRLRSAYKSNLDNQSKTTLGQLLLKQEILPLKIQDILSVRFIPIVKQQGQTVHLKPIDPVLQQKNRMPDSFNAWDAIIPYQTFSH